MNVIGEGLNRVLLPQRAVRHVFPQAAYRDVAADAGECSIGFPAPATKTKGGVTG